MNFNSLNYIELNPCEYIVCFLQHWSSGVCVNFFLLYVWKDPLAIHWIYAINDEQPITFMTKFEFWTGGIWTDNLHSTQATVWNLQYYWVLPICIQGSLKPVIQGQKIWCYQKALIDNWILVSFSSLLKICLTFAKQTRGKSIRGKFVQLFYLVAMEIFLQVLLGNEPFFVYFIEGLRSKYTILG